MTFSRRSWMKGASALLVAGGLPHTAIARCRQNVIGIGDTTVRSQLASDYPATLKALKRMGYSHFGFRLEPYSASEAAEPSGIEKAAMVRDAGLKVGPVRFGFLTPFDDQIEVAQAISADQIVLTAGRIFFGQNLTERTPSLSELEDFVGSLDELGAKTRGAGVRFAYHNHWFDSQPIDGVIPLDLMQSRTDPKNVSFELDLAWAFYAGEDPIKLIGQMGERLLSYHLKDIKAELSDKILQNTVPVGEGVMDYANLYPRIRSATSAMPVVEVDEAQDGLDAAKRAIDFINALSAD